MDKKRISIVFLIVFTNMVGASVVIPILPLYAFDRLGATPFQAALVIASFFAAQVIGAPLLGRWADRFGRRPVLIISQIGTVLSYMVLTFALPLGAMLAQGGWSWGISGALLVVYLARLLDGLTGGNISVAQAYVSDISQEKNRTQALGIVGGAGALGFLVGPAFGGLLAGINLTAPFVGAAVITGLTLCLTIWLLDESLTPEIKAQTATNQTSKIPVSHLLTNRLVLLIMTIAFLVTLGFSSIQSTFSLYADHVLFPTASSAVVARNAGLMVASIGLMIGLGQLFLVKPLVTRWGEQTLVIFGYALFFASLVGIGSMATPSVWGVLLLFIPFSLGWAIGQPSLQGLITRFGSQQTNGRLLGLYQSTNSIAFTIGPALGGLIFQLSTPQTVFFTAAGLLLVAVGLSGWLSRHIIPFDATRYASPTSSPLPSPTPGD